MYRKAPWFVRPVAFNPPSPGKWLFTLAFALLFSGLAVFAYSNMREMATLVRDGATVTGAVIDRERTVTVHEDSEGSTREEVHYYIEYSYDAGRGDPPDIRTARQEVSRTFYNGHGTESALTVYYMPDNRSHSGIDMNHVLGNGTLMLVAFGVVAAAAWYVLLANMIAARY